MGDYQLGVAVGGLVALSIAVIIVFAKKKMGDEKPNYDERQKLVRGIGAGYALKTVVFALLALIIIDAFDVTLPIPNSFIYYTLVILAVLVQACYGIAHDSYVAVNQKSKQILLSSGGIGLINLLIAVVLFLNRDEYTKNSFLSSGMLNVECGLAMLTICAVLIVKNVLDKKKVQAEEEEDD